MSFFSNFVKLLFGSISTRSTWGTERAEGGEFRLRTHGKAAAAVTSVDATQEEGDNETENGETGETTQYAACN